MIIYGYVPKSKKKVTKRGQQQNDEWLASINKLSTNFSRGNVKTDKKITVIQEKVYCRETFQYPSLNTNTGSATKQPAKVYTGQNILGIATMHKSNAVPVFNSEQAVEISSMRR